MKSTFERDVVTALASVQRSLDAASLSLSIVAQRILTDPTTDVLARRFVESAGQLAHANDALRELVKTLG